MERGLSAKIDIVYQKGSQVGGGHISKSEALSGLRRIQRLIGYLMFLSAACGVFLLATDNSLWILAVSHAVGLVIVVILDVVLGVMNLSGVMRVYIASLAGATLGIVLQLGDIATAPQYGMTMAYFASYLLGLPAFDLLLSLQVVILLVGLVGRTNVQFLAHRRRVGRELNYSRRSFMTTIVGFAALVGFGVALGSVKIPQDTSQSQSNSLVAGGNVPISNTNSMQVDSPVYFQYPSGYPNVLFKRGDGTLAAYSLLCTHVCCEVTYEGSSNGFYCPCHGSKFDASGNVLIGPASTPLPSVTLTVDNSGNIFPTGTVGYSPC